MKIISVVGARPNFMKIAPFIKAIHHHNKNQALNPPLSAQQKNRAAGEPASRPSQQPAATSPLVNTNTIQHLLVHTGQHYDDRLSKAFFKALEIPEADINLGVGSGSHAEQVGHTMIQFEKVLIKEKPDWVVVVGDVNATLACSVTAKKLHIKVCHIEAGLRSGDIRMPEEVNRLVTDRLADLLLIPDLISGENLRKEGTKEHRIHFVGNIMIDTLESQRTKAASLSIQNIIQENLLIPNNNSQKEHNSPLPSHLAPSITATFPNRFALMTMHRPSNVDHPEVLRSLFDFLSQEVQMPLIWPIHPRAQKQLKAFGLWEKAMHAPNLILLHPVGYHEMLRMNMDAHIMLTDSGGLQEECCVLGTPCLTLRWNTERPITLRENGGASVLVGNNVNRIREAYHNTLAQKRQPMRPELWDGKTAERCLNALLNYPPA